MNFNKWLLNDVYLESSLQGLYQSAVDAFPRTTKRQHAIDPIKIENLRFVPYLGVKTLFIKGLAQNETKKYNPMILFKNVTYYEEATAGAVRIESEGRRYFLDRLSMDDNHIVIRCNCPDFHWRFNFYNHLNKSLYGSKRTRYENQGGPPANPMEKEGMCKHAMKMIKILSEIGIIS